MFGEDVSLSFGLNRESPYSFKCQRCGICCNNKRIVPSPSERARLAAFLGISEDRFIAEYLNPESGELRSTPDGDCIFLGPGSCRIHPARLLVCRLFPLGLLRNQEGGEAFGIMPLHPDCLGLLGTDGTVGEDLKAQGVDTLLENERQTK
ncbi:MAG: YkgJ family cysteine cluster protein [Candidatus Aminicenantes bacterium]|nr:YkgJ family cysteine cluster protein [Candidatus Aminicenantes bacterium]